MTVLFLLLLVAALVCFTIAAVGHARRVNLVALGLLCWVIVPVIQTLQALLT